MVEACEGPLPPAEGLLSLLGAFANKPSLSGVSGPGDSGKGFGNVPRRSASPGPRLSTGLAFNLGVVSFVPVLFIPGVDSCLPDCPEAVLSGAGLESSGYGALCTRGSDGFGYLYTSLSSGYGSGFAELEAPGGRGKEC